METGGAVVGGICGGVAAAEGAGPTILPFITWTVKCFVKRPSFRIRMEWTHIGGNIYSISQITMHLTSCDCR